MKLNRKAFGWDFIEMYDLKSWIVNFQLINTRNKSVQSIVMNRYA